MRGVRKGEYDSIPLIYLTDSRDNTVVGWTHEELVEGHIQKLEASMGSIPGYCFNQIFSTLRSSQ
jgi:hypothetical protein